MCAPVPTAGDPRPPSAAARVDVIATDRLVLRQQTAEDAPFVLALMNDPDWLRHIGDRGVRTVEDARAYITDGAVAMYARCGHGLYLVERAADRAPVGVCGLLQRTAGGDVDLGFALAREHRGYGYAREAAAATVAYGRAVVGLRRIVAIVSADNAASVRLLGDLGFRFERVLEDSSERDVHLYARSFHPPL